MDKMEQELVEAQLYEEDTLLKLYCTNMQILYDIMNKSKDTGIKAEELLPTYSYFVKQIVSLMDLIMTRLPKTYYNLITEKKTLDGKTYGDLFEEVVDFYNDKMEWDCKSPTPVEIKENE